MDKIISSLKIFILKNYELIILQLTIFFLVGSVALGIKWCGNAVTFGDNILVEFFIGGLCSIVPLSFYLFLHRSAKEEQFYTDIRGFINIIRAKRESGKIGEDLAQDIIVQFSHAVDSDILDEPWYKKKLDNDKLKKDKIDCGVCGKKEQTIKNEKCEKCKLKCFAWT